jgi:hypothetical protein
MLKSMQSILAANVETDTARKVGTGSAPRVRFVLQSSPAVFNPITTPSADYWRDAHP